MSRPCRAGLYAVVALLTLASAAHADVAQDLRGRTAFTLAGGGTSKPADGLPAGDAKLFVYQLAGLPDGQTVLWIDDPHPLWRVDLAGRLHPLGARGRIGTFAVDPGTGELVIVPGRKDVDGSTIPLARIERLPLEGGRPKPFAKTPNFVWFVVPLGAGQYAASDGRSVWRVTPGGRASVLARRRGLIGRLLGPGDRSLGALVGDNKLIAVPGSRTIGRLPRYANLLGATPGGVLFADAVREKPVPGGDYTTTARTPAEALGRLRFGPDAGPFTTLAVPLIGAGTGDGGPLATARVNAEAAALAPNGDLLAVDRPVDSYDPKPWVDAPASGDRVVVAVGPGTARPLVAIDPTHPWSVLTTVAGRVTLTLRGGGRTLSTAADMPAGIGALPWDPASPPPGRYRAEARLTTPDGAVAVARTTIDTGGALTDAEAKSLAAQRVKLTGSDALDLGACTRTSAVEVACKVESINYGARTTTVVVRDSFDGRHVVWQK